MMKSECQYSYKKFSIKNAHTRHKESVVACMGDAVAVKWVKRLVHVEEDI